MRTILALLLAPLLPLAGCIAQDAPPVEPAEAPDAGPATRAPSPPSEAAPPGGAPAMEEPTAPPAEDAPDPAPALSALALSWEGTTQTFFCVPSSLPACGFALPHDGTERYVPAFEGTPHSARITLAWEADSPLTETLVLHVEGVAGCDDACHAMGASPLELVLDDIALAEDWALTIHAFVPCQVCDGHDKMMDPGQSFTISGELVYAPYA